MLMAFLISWSWQELFRFMKFMS